MTLTDREYEIAEADCKSMEDYIHGLISYRTMCNQINEHNGKKIPASKIDEWLNQGYTEDFSKIRKRK